MTDETTRKVLRKLLSDHYGQDNPITQGKLANALDMNTSTLRSELRRLREERNIPIANQRNGYYIISDKSELQEYIGHINQEIESKKQTIEHTLEAWDEFDHDSIDIDPEPDVVEQTYDCSHPDCPRSMARESCYYPKSGDFEDQPLCKLHYGKFRMDS